MNRKGDPNSTTGKNENDGRNGIGDCAATNRPSSNTQPLIKPRGDYRTLLSYQKTEVIYEFTYRFCQRFLSKTDRTTDQMTQAARSGKQNIIEGSKAGTTSRETEIKLTNVARASLEELLEDYLDYLRVHDAPPWPKDSREARYARQMGTKQPLTFESFRVVIETRPACVVANLALCLIHQANYLLDRQLQSLGESFVKEGGFRERMTQVRLEARSRRKDDPAH